MAPFLTEQRPSVSRREVSMSTFKTLSVFLLLVTNAVLVSGQLSSFCNPLEVKCPPAPGFSSPEPYVSEFRTGSDDRVWTSVGESSSPITYGNNQGAKFTINRQGDSPVLESDQYLFFGSVEVHLRAAPGRGIVSCIVLLSDTLDEVDFEMLGGPEQAGLVQTNYFGKGVTGNFENGEGHWLPFGPSTTTGQVHNYTVDWDKDKIVWLIDGVQVRRLDKEMARPVGAVPGRDTFPQAPARVRIGMWAGGDPRNAEGTIGWAGGVTDFVNGPPYEMVVESVRILNKYPAAAYWLKDYSGQWESVQRLDRYFERGDRGKYVSGYGDVIEGGYANATFGGHEDEDTDAGNGGYDHHEERDSGNITIEHADNQDNGQDTDGGQANHGNEYQNEKENENKNGGSATVDPEHGHDEPDPGSVGTEGREGGAPGVPDRPVGTPVVHIDHLESFANINASLDGPWRVVGLVTVVVYFLSMGLFTW